MSTQERVPGTYATAAAWSDAGAHEAQLPSGVWVKFRYPDLSLLAGAGKVPIGLKAIALRRIAGELKLLMEPEAVAEGEPTPPATIDDEELAQNRELNGWLLSQMIVEPQISPEEVWSLPVEDTDMLLEFADRLRDTDARGVVLGIVPLSRFARFRQAHAKHGLCGEDCPGCEELRTEGVSRLRLDAV